MEQASIKERNNTVNDQLGNRQHWMSTMAKSCSQLLHALSDNLIDESQFETIRAPEIGLTQVRARMGGTGSPFNLGDMTITRCVVRSTAGHYGYSYIAGRDKAHALRAAQLDAVLQTDSNSTLINEQVVRPLENQLQHLQQQKTAETSATKVNFFTLVRGED